MAAAAAEKTAAVWPDQKESLASGVWTPPRAQASGRSRPAAYLAPWVSRMAVLPDSASTMRSSITSRRPAGAAWIQSVAAAPAGTSSWSASEAVDAAPVSRQRSWRRAHPSNRGGSHQRQVGATRRSLKTSERPIRPSSPPVIDAAVPRSTVSLGWAGLTAAAATRGPWPGPAVSSARDDQARVRASRAESARAAPEAVMAATCHGRLAE